MKQSQPQQEKGRVKVKFFWKTSLVLSIVLTAIAMVVLNLIF